MCLHVRAQVYVCSLEKMFDAYLAVELSPRAENWHACVTSINEDLHTLTSRNQQYSRFSKGLSLHGVSIVLYSKRHFVVYPEQLRL